MSDVGSPEWYAVQFGPQKSYREMLAPQDFMGNEIDVPAMLRAIASIDWSDPALDADE